MDNLIRLCKFYGGPLDGFEVVGEVFHDMLIPQASPSGGVREYHYRLVKLDTETACYLF